MTLPAAARPLKPGTVISYADIQATVVCDHGIGSVDVLCEGTRQTWRWTLDGEDCQVVSVPPGELAYRTLESYLKDFPSAERAKGWFTRGRPEALWFFKLVDPAHQSSPHGGMDGNYMWVSQLRLQNGTLRLAAHDCDDGLMVRDFPVGQELEAQSVLEEMAELAPFSMWDAAKTFDFIWD